MPVRRHPQQPLAAEHLRGARRAAVGDDGEIELVGVDPLDQIDRRLAQHGQLDAGIGAREPRHDLRQIAVGVVVRQAEPHAAGELLVVERGERLDVELDDAARVVEQPLAVLGELGGAAVAGEDRRPSRSSSRFICIDTADWVLCTTSAALVKLPVSTMAMKVRSWSTSIRALMGSLLKAGMCRPGDPSSFADWLD